MTTIQILHFCGAYGYAIIPFKPNKGGEIMLYLREFSFLTQAQEEDFFIALKRTCYSTPYPFAIFPQTGLERLEFEPITLLAGGNGSGKTTALNVIAQALGADRTAPYNSGAFFAEYAAHCQFAAGPDAAGGFAAEFIASDDVFDFIFNIRSLNDGIDIRREELFEEWLKPRSPNAEPVRVRSMADYSALVQQNRARRMTQSAFVRASLMHNVRAHSNGESALLFFMDKINENKLYIVDEPENSLSAASQQKLAEYIENAARFFGCQFIISTHSPYMLSLKGAKVYDMDSRPAKSVRWADIAAMRAMFDFFMQHKRDFGQQ